MRHVIVAAVEVQEPRPVLDTGARDDDGKSVLMAAIAEAPLPAPERRRVRRQGAEKT